MLTPQPHISRLKADWLIFGLKYSPVYKMNLNLYGICFYSER